MSNFGSFDERFGRNAAGVESVTAHDVTLDEGSFASGNGSTDGRYKSARSTTNCNEIVFAVDIRVFPV